MLFLLSVAILPVICSYSSSCSCLAGDIVALSTIYTSTFCALSLKSAIKNRCAHSDALWDNFPRDHTHQLILLPCSYSRRIPQSFLQFVSSPAGNDLDTALGFYLTYFFVFLIQWSWCFIWPEPFYHSTQSLCFEGKAYCSRLIRMERSCLW